MKIELTQRNISRDAYESTHRYIRDLAERHLQPHVRAFKASELRLHATVEHEKTDYRVAMHLHLPPRKTLVAHAADANIRTALQRAIEELARQAERHQAHISGSERWKRKQRRRKFRELEARVGKLSATIDASEASLAELLPRLESWLRQEMTYLRANGDLLEDYPTLAEVRDEVFLTVKARWDEIDHDQESLYCAMLQAAADILMREVASNRASEGMLSLEQPPAADAEQQAEEMVGEEFEEFYQPDEVLHVEDLAPAPESADHELTEEERAIALGYRVMGWMPIRWRQMLNLHYRESLSPERIASEIFRTDPADVQATIDKARQFIVEHLRQEGLEDHADMKKLLR